MLMQITENPIIPGTLKDVRELNGVQKGVEFLLENTDHEKLVVKFKKKPLDLRTPAERNATHFDVRFLSLAVQSLDPHQFRGVRDAFLHAEQKFAHVLLMQFADGMPGKVKKLFAEEMPRYVQQLAVKHNAVIVTEIYQSTDKKVEESRTPGGICDAVATQWINLSRNKSWDDFHQLFKDGADQSLINLQLQIGANKGNMQRQVNQEVNQQIGELRSLWVEGQKIWSQDSSLMKEFQLFQLLAGRSTGRNTAPLPSLGDMINRGFDEKERTRLVPEAQGRPRKLQDNEKQKMTIRLAVNNRYVEGQKELDEYYRGLCGACKMELEMKEKTISILSYIRCLGPGYYLVRLRKSGEIGGPGHVIAFYVSNSTCSMVDANSGELKFQSQDSLNEFFEDYWWDVYQEKYMAGNFFLFKVS
jgi:hypothetical protein